MKRIHRLLAMQGLFFACLTGWVVAAPVPKQNADQAARGWLRRNVMPMEAAISREAGPAEAFQDADGCVLYYSIPLTPQGFVVLSADDRIEPVIAFSATGRFDSFPNNPLKDLLERDMQGRLEGAAQETFAEAGVPSGQSSKWQTLLEAGADLPVQDDGGIQSAGLTSVSDVRVAPLLQSKWGQGGAAGGYCYDYYTPNHYVAGCVATAMAQLMRYHSWPTAGIGVHLFRIYVDDVEQYRNTRGGDGSGGAYNWSQMPYDPEAGVTTAQRQAIGALCYDAGLSVNMGYTSSGSGASTSTADLALIDTFGYANSIYGYVYATYVNAGLTTMMHPNLDAGLPVILSISGTNAAHAVLADGYGYNNGMAYHHLNMGWTGLDDAWYQLPPDTPSIPFTVINGCLYNVYPAGTGEIVSGRITSMAGAALEGVTVTAYRGSSPVKQATTNSRGIYALKNLASNTTFRLSAVKSGYVFADQNVSTGSSADWGTSSGNKWAINFAAANAMPPTAMDQTVDANSLSSRIIYLEVLDDHRPSPPDKIRCSIMSLPVHGTLSEPNVGPITQVPCLLAVDANSVQYTPCPYYGGPDSFTFKANDGGTAPTGGDSNIATVTVNVDNTLSSSFGLDGDTGTNTMIDTERYACRSQVIYLSGDIGSAKTLTDLTLNFTSVPPLTLRRWTIRMQPTDWTEYPNNYDKTYMMLTDGWTVVYQADLTLTSTGWHNFHFQTPFKYNGTQNLLIDFSFDNLNINSVNETGWYLFKDVGTFRSMTIKTSDTPHADPLTWDFWAGGGYYTGGGWLPSLKLTGTVPIDPLAGDFDLSCDVKLPDLAMLSTAWMTQQGQAHYDPACDISSPRDNAVNLSDLLVFANHWLQHYQP